MSEKKDIVSATPDKLQIIDVKDIEGIGSKYAKKLKSVGLKNSEDLRKASLVEVVESTKISPKLVYKWQCMSDLARLRRVAEEYSELLFEMGIETVSEVARQNVDDLAKDVEKFYEKAKKMPGWHGDVRKKPNESDISKWIESAKELITLRKEITDSDLKVKAQIESKSPEAIQIGDVEEIEGIGPEYAKQLKEYGIDTTEKLRIAPLVELVEATHISPKYMYKWICMADLFRLRRVAEEYSDLLFYAGVETVSEVAQQKAKDLHKRILKVADEAEKKPGWQGDVNKVPSASDVKKWIVSAKDLIKK